MTENTEMSSKDYNIITTKHQRVDLDKILQDIKLKLSNKDSASKEKDTAIMKIQEAIMWLGMELKRLGNEDPYPNSYKPENAIVDPTADNLEL